MIGFDPTALTNGLSRLATHAQPHVQSLPIPRSTPDLASSMLSLPVSKLLPMQGEEFCSTAAGGLIEAFVGIMIVVFFGAILVATFAAAGIEAMPMSGWWNQMGYSMMGKVPISVMFVVVMISVISMTITNGTLGISVPPCIPILG